MIEAMHSKKKYASTWQIIADASVWESELN